MSEIAIYKQLSIVNGNDLRFGFSNRPRQLATRLVGGALQGCQRIESGARRDISFFISLTTTTCTIPAHRGLRLEP